MTSDLIRKDPENLLLIGAVLGDSDTVSKEWGTQIGRLSKAARAASAGLDSPLRLNVVYHVDGDIVATNFDGVRTGRLFKASGTLEVQAAIPKNSPGDRQSVLLAALGSAIDEAERYSSAKKLDMSAVRMVYERLLST